MNDSATYSARKRSFVQWVFFWFFLFFSVGVIWQISHWVHNLIARCAWMDFIFLSLLEHWVSVQIWFHIFEKMLPIQKRVIASKQNAGLWSQDPHKDLLLPQKYLNLLRQHSHYQLFHRCIGLLKNTVQGLLKILLPIQTVHDNTDFGIRHKNSRF